MAWLNPPENVGMAATPAEYDAIYLATVKNPEIYQRDLIASVNAVLRDCTLGLETTRASLWVLPEGERDLACLSLFDAATGEYEQGAILSEAALPRYFEALYNGRVLDADDTFADPRTNELTDSYLSVLDVRSLLDATIRNVTSGELRGVLCCELVGKQRNWSEADKMFVTSMADLLAQRLITSDWERSQRQYQTLYEASNEGIMLFSNGVFASVNPAGHKMFGATGDELIGLSPVDVSPEYQPDGQPSAIKALGYIERCFAGESPTFDWHHCRVDGTVFDAEVTLNGVHLYGEQTLFALIRDVTEKKEAERRARISQSEVEYRAAHDSLTGLLNREQLHLHVEDLLSSAPGDGYEVALMLLDLNRFKEINDTLGHSTGDRVLVKVAEVLNPRIEDLGGVLFRLGGDEFVAAFDTHRALMPFDDLIGEIHDCLSSAIEVGGVSFVVGASIGAAVYPGNGRDSHELLRCADVAMYHAKNHDGAAPWYERENDVHNKKRLSMVTDLSHAIGNDELVLHFQPQINLQTGETTGCEALVRWNHAERGLIPPAEFLGLAEMTDLIHPLSEWVIESTIHQMQKLASIGHDLPVAVNLSARNLPDTRLVDLIESLLKANGVAPERLEVEITESALINNPQRAMDNLNRLRGLGVTIAIDDFGTGYSSLRLLKQLPPDTLKVDRSFVKEMLESPTDYSIVSSTIALGQNLSARIIAEGVEDQATLNALADLKCEGAQGYFIAKPMPATEFERWLTEQRSTKLSA